MDATFPACRSEDEKISCAKLLTRNVKLKMILLAEVSCCKGSRLSAACRVRVHRKRHVQDKFVLKLATEVCSKSPAHALGIGRYLT